MSSPKHHGIISVAYDAGLRVPGAGGLHIDCKQRAIHVRNGKSDLARYTMLCERLLATLRAYFATVRPPGPFPGGAPAHRQTDLTTVRVQDTPDRRH